MNDSLPQLNPTQPQPQPPPQPPARRISKALRESIVLIAVALAVFVGMRVTMQTYIVYGPSMQPNFVENQRLIVSKVAYWVQEPGRGDVIVFRPPFTEQSNFIKRIIALPGESVEVKDGKVLVYKADGSVITLIEPYVREPARETYRKHTVPEGQYFVLGDNRNNTNDSRNGWYVPSDSIVGKAWVTIWPPDRWGDGQNHAFADGAAEGADAR